MHALMDTFVAINVKFMLLEKDKKQNTVSSGSLIHSKFEKFFFGNIFDRKPCFVMIAFFANRNTDLCVRFGFYICYHRSDLIQNRFGKNLFYLFVRMGMC